MVRRRLSQLPLARCPQPAAGVVVLVSVEASGEVRAASSSSEPCLRATLATVPAFSYGADGGRAWNTALLVAPAP
jgi:hypothetical protein